MVSRIQLPLKTWGLSALIIFSMSLCFALVRSTTVVVWDDSHSVTAIQLDGAGPKYGAGLSVLERLADSFSKVSPAGYRPISTFLAHLGLTYIAEGGSVFLWSLIPGFAMGCLAIVLFHTSQIFLKDWRWSLIASFLYLLSSPFVASAWIIAAGVQAFVPLLICSALLFYERLRLNQAARLCSSIGLALIFLIGPWFREFVGCAPILILVRDLAAQRRFTRLQLGCILGLAHAVFPGALVSIFLDGAPTDPVFKLGLLGGRLESGPLELGSIVNSLKFQIVPHLLVLVPSTLLLIAALGGLGYFKRIRYQKATSDLRDDAFLFFWLVLTLAPFLKVFTEEVHLLYPLLPFLLLVSRLCREVVDLTPQKTARPLRTQLGRIGMAVLLILSIGDQGLNSINSYAIVSQTNLTMAQIAQQIVEKTPANSVIIGNALHLDDIRSLSRGHFEAYWTVRAGLPRNDRTIENRDALVDLRKQSSKPLYLLDFDYAYLPDKFEYHSHRLARDPEIAKELVIEIPMRQVYWYLDPVKAWLPRSYTTVLFAPDLENDFYRGPERNQLSFRREVSVTYRLHRLIEADKD